MTPPENEELNLGELTAALRRRWLILLAGTLLGGCAAVITTARSPQTWQGSFQLVVSKDEGSAGGGLSSLLGGNPLLANLAGLGGGGGTEIGTQVEVLKSASVLTPVFEQWQRRQPNPGLTFDDWGNRLTVKLQKDTSVLEVSYQDSQRNAILPVLQAVSQAYQTYSIQHRSRSLRNGVAYAQEQLNRFRTKADQSNRNLDAYRIRYGIAADSSTNFGTGIDVSKLISPAAGSSGAINVQGGGSSSNLQSQGDALGQLASLNQELIRRRQLFTDADPSIKALVRERDALKRYIETTALGTLTLPGQAPLSKEQAQEIVLRYQELDRVAKRETATVDSLENALLSLELEQARGTKPWQVITSPSVDDHPLSPRPARNLAVGLLSGLVLGCAIGLVVDRRSGLVFGADDIQQQLGSNPLAVLHGSSPESWHTTLALLAQASLAQAEDVALIPLGIPLEEPALQALQQELQALLPNATIHLSADLLAASASSHQLLVAAPGAANTSQLSEVQQQLGLLTKPITGWLLLEAA
jgi:capsular polysaccharide biosynthesis protein